MPPLMRVFDFIDILVRILPCTSFPLGVPLSRSSVPMIPLLVFSNTVPVLVLAVASAQSFLLPLPLALMFLVSLLVSLALSAT